MADHRRTHPDPVDGCFGCKALTVGVATLRSRHGVDPVQRIQVMAEDGPFRGRVTGHHDIHWDGRQDATVRAPAVTVAAQATEIC